MNLAVIKNPNEFTTAQCRELGDATGPLLKNEELMTEKGLDAWLQEPEQVAKLQALREAAQAQREAEEAERLLEVTKEQL